MHDTIPPLVSIDVPSSSGLSVPISWQSQDSESGLRSYTVRYRQEESGPSWTTWLTGTTATSGQFPGAADQTYYFQVEAVDNVNNTTAQAGPVTVQSVTKYYYHGGTRVAMRQGDVVYFLHGDHLGSTSLTTDATGAPIAQTRYLPYGEQRWTDGDTPTDFTFTGQRADGFGLLDYNARYYDSGLGRFISPDTVIPDPTNPQNLNRYSYVLGNPVKFSDPSGHCPIGICAQKDMLLYGSGPGGYSPTGSSGGGSVVGPVAVGTLIGLGIRLVVDHASSLPPIPLDTPAQGLPESVPLPPPDPASIPGTTLLPHEAPVEAFPLGNNEPLTFGLPLQRPAVVGDNILRSSRELAANMEKAGITRPPNSAAHHIVAENDPRAAQSRAILQREGIGINDAVNGVYLPRNTRVANPTGATAHSITHTDTYYDIVLRDLSNASPGTVRDVLKDIGQRLQNNNYPH